MFMCVGPASHPPDPLLREGDPALPAAVYQGQVVDEGHREGKHRGAAPGQAE